MIDLHDAAEWCAVERNKLGAIDGYDYRSGEEFGLRRAEIELRRRAEITPHIDNRAAAVLEMVLEWHEAGEDPQELIKVITTVKWALEKSEYPKCSAS